MSFTNDDISDIITYHADLEKKPEGELTKRERAQLEGFRRVRETVQFTTEIGILTSTADKKDPQNMWEHFCDYIKLCQKYSVKPGNMGAYTAMGLTPAEVSNIMTGRQHSDKPEFKQILSQVKNILATFREVAMSEKDGLNPIVGIWWQKNYDGLMDNPKAGAIQESAEPEMDAQTIREKYADLPED